MLCYVKIHLFYSITLFIYYHLYNIVFLVFIGYNYKLIKCIYFMMREGVTKVYILPKAPNVIEPVYTV